jgi:uncharacterized protein
VRDANRGGYPTLSAPASGCAAVELRLSLDFPTGAAQRSPMPTLRDLVLAVRQRPGVMAALVVGRDGLLIDGAHDPALDPDALAAHVPPLLLSAAAVGAASRLAPPEREQAEPAGPRLLVCEFPDGALVLATLGREAALLALVHPDGELAPLVQDLRRHRERLATLT